MNRLFFSVAFAAVLLGACSSAEYKVNSPPVAKEPVAEEVPESQKEGYMRILGDLRWDELTSKEQWVERFPSCLQDQGTKIGIAFGDGQTHKEFVWNPYGGKRPCNFDPGGIPVNLDVVAFEDNSGTNSGTSTIKVYFSLWDIAQSRAMKAAIAEKYGLTTEGYCSRYTCWNLSEVSGIHPTEGVEIGPVYFNWGGDGFCKKKYNCWIPPKSGPRMAGYIQAIPTPYTLSLLDQVKINTSEL